MSKNREQLSQRTVRVLDASRALAALAVVLQHSRTSLLVDPESLTRPGIATRLVYWASGFGHQAVVVFFVLSGALVGGSVVRSVSDGKWSWSEYLIRRLSRLYVVLVPALLLIVLWDGLGSAFFPFPGAYRDVMSAITVGGHTLIVHNRSVLAYIGNAVFLMTIYVPVFGSGAALWSLSNEFWYYILFPCIALAVSLRRESWRSLAYAVLLLGISFFVGRDIVKWMSVWLLGVVAIRAPRVSISPRYARWIQAGALAGFAIVTALDRTLLNTISLRGDFIVGASFALLLYCVFCSDSSQQVVTHRYSSGRWKLLAGFSYSLYLFHQPPLTFASVWLRHTYRSRLQPTALHVGVMVAAVLVAVLYSYALSLLTEAQTDRVRRFLTRTHRDWAWSRQSASVDSTA